MTCSCEHHIEAHVALMHGGRGACNRCECGMFRSTPAPAPGTDMVNHPPHYTSHPSGVECIQVTEHQNFCIGNAIKYLWRCDGKNGLEDLKKARWYVDREIARREKADA